MTTTSTVPALGRYNYREWRAAMRSAYTEIQVSDLRIGHTLVRSDCTEVEVIHIEPHRDLTGRLIRNWVTVTTLTADGHQERTGRWLADKVFILRPPNAVH